MCWFYESFKDLELEKIKTYPEELIFLYLPSARNYEPFLVHKTLSWFPYPTLIPKSPYRWHLNFFVDVCSWRLSPRR